MAFKPKEVICSAKTDSFKYTCKNVHLDEQEHEVNNTYRFNKGVPYLVKNQEDYDELVNHDMFEAYDKIVVPKIVPKVTKVESSREKKAREKAEAKDIKEQEELAKESEANTPEENVEAPVYETGETEEDEEEKEELKDEVE